MLLLLPQDKQNCVFKPDHEWVQCDKCRKWRILPSDFDSRKLFVQWYVKRYHFCLSFTCNKNKSLISLGNLLWLILNFSYMLVMEYWLKWFSLSLVCVNIFWYCSGNPNVSYVRILLLLILVGWILLTYMFWWRGFSMEFVFCMLRDWIGFIKTCKVKRVQKAFSGEWSPINYFTTLRDWLQCYFLLLSLQ